MTAPGLCPGRVLQPELMDDPACGPDEFHRCLRDLATVNRVTLAYRPTLAFLAHAVRLHPPRDRPLRILDVGGGYGDALRRIDRWAARRDVALDMTSVDLSPWARGAGEAGASTRQPIRFVTADVFGFTPDPVPDLVLSSLFAHHLDDVGVVRFLGWMERHARLGWFVNDLRRHWLPHAGFRALSAAAGWHRFVRHDGPVSIRRAFTRADWRVLLAEAGLPAETAGAARIEAWLPFRLCVSRLRPDPATPSP